MDRIFFYKLRTHADPIVLHTELVHSDPAHSLVFLCPRKLPQPHQNPAANRSKLNGIRQKIEKDLVQSRLITTDRLICYLPCIHGNLNLRQIIPHLFLLIHAASAVCAASSRAWLTFLSSVRSDITKIYLLLPSTSLLMATI